MSDNKVLLAEARVNLGKGSSRRLRRLEDKVPAIVYGNNQPAESIAILYKDIVKITEDESFLSTIIELKYNDKTTSALIKDMQRHPARNNITHVDFIRVNLNKPIKVNIPIHFINSQQCLGVKQQGGIFISELSEIEIMCLPNKIPEYIEVDVQNMEIGDTMHIKAIKLPDAIVLAPASEDFYKTTVARIIKEGSKEIQESDLDNEAEADEEAEKATE